MALYRSMQELIGDTPLVQLQHFDLPDGVRLFAKLELYNPSGSVKDRTGLYMIRAAERSGVLRRGATIVLGTAGNTGLGIAFAALNRGYELLFVVPTKFSEEKQILLRALGAQVINTPREDGMLGAERKAAELTRQIPGAVTLDQFKDQSNPQAHYETTGREIWEDLHGDVQYVVAGAGSGGTITGILRYLKEKDPSVQGVLADPEGSTMGGGAHHDYDIVGIGNDFIADTMDMSLIDRVIKMNDEEAFTHVRLLAEREGIIAGSSSGAALAASLKLARSGVKGNIVTVFPDRGDRYFSTKLFT